MCMCMSKLTLTLSQLNRNKMMLKKQIIPRRHAPQPPKHRRLHRAPRIRPIPIDKIMIIPDIHAGDMRGGDGEQALREPPQVAAQEDAVQLGAHRGG